MSAVAPRILSLAIDATLLLLLAGMAMAFVRLVRGPHLADRVVALELISTLVVAFVAAWAIYAGDEAFLDVAIGFALVAFLGTVAFARYAERRAAARTRTQTAAARAVPSAAEAQEEQP